MPLTGAEITLRDLIRVAAAKHPYSEAVVDGAWRYTYAGLLDQVQRMAKLLHTLGVRKGDRVALLMPPSAAHLIALFGAIELGAIPVALHVRETEAVLAALLHRFAPRALVYDAAFADKAKALRQRCTWVTAAVRAISGMTPADSGPGSDEPLIPRDLGNYTLDFEPMPVAPGDTAVIALSSGTTGAPKGVMHTHRTLLASARLGCHYVAAHPRTVTINTFTTAFIGWYNCTLPPLYGASKIIFLGRWDPQEFLQTIEREKVTLCFLVPTMWRMVLRALAEQHHDLSSLERVGYAGEPMDTRTMAEIRGKICHSVINTYGTTETGSWGGCTVMLPEDYASDDRIDSVGKPGMEVGMRVIRPGGSIDEPLPRGEEGEIVIRGPSVASQFWEQPALARSVFAEGWWRSGDMGKMDQEGYVFLKGRVDDMIITGGINVFPGEVEDAVLSHPAVGECAVIGLPSETWGQQVTAFVIRSANVSAEELLAHVNRTALASYKRPREYRFVTELPRGNTGKISRKLLRDQAMNL
ncbi:MAG TPA: class I adenylate-forming enzyme family protein [Xanthomonadales bacterium]|nr:class I adenylate-forming enzyme family protein [Xanthomonadales bacterium]